MLLRRSYYIPSTCKSIRKESLSVRSWEKKIEREKRERKGKRKLREKKKLTGVAAHPAILLSIPVEKWQILMNRLSRGKAVCV